MQVRRIGPLIDTGTEAYDPKLHSNINGPSLICVPDWVENPLGRYYLYFAHHHDDHIRMAYAEDLAGPYTILRGGVMPLVESAFVDHIASPDVQIVDGQIRMYYHGIVTELETNLEIQEPFFARQRTRVAVSRDGLRFFERPQVIASAYLRVFRLRDWYYGLTMPGLLYRSRDGLTDFERGPLLFGDDINREAYFYSGTNPNPRHFAVQVVEDRIRFFYSIVPGTPESIYMSEVHAVDDNWEMWKPSPPQLVLAPEMDYEGGDLPVETSARGKIDGRVCQLRDPAIYEEDGRTYLLYSTAGESGIAIAELLEGGADVG